MGNQQETQFAHIVLFGSESLLFAQLEFLLHWACIPVLAWFFASLLDPRNYFCTQQKIEQFLPATRLLHPQWWKSACYANHWSTLVPKWRDSRSFNPLSIHTQILFMSSLFLSNSLTLNYIKNVQVWGSCIVPSSPNSPHHVREQFLFLFCFSWALLFWRFGDLWPDP